MRAALGSASGVAVDRHALGSHRDSDNRKCLDQETLTGLVDRRTEMRRITFLAAMGLVFLFGSSAAETQAQVKQVEMHIDGYLCGN